MALTSLPTYRQGQTQTVTLVRFLIRGTKEHDLYLKTWAKEDAKAALNNQQGVKSVLQEKASEGALSRSKSATAKLFRANSITSLLANSGQTTVAPATIIKLLEEE